MPELTNGPAELVAIARAAHVVGDKALKRNAIRALRARFGIKLTFPRQKKESVGSGDAE